MPLGRALKVGIDPDSDLNGAAQLAFFQTLMDKANTKFDYMVTPHLFDHFMNTVTRIGSSTTTDWVQKETGTGTSHAVWAQSATGSGEAIGVAGATTNNAEELGGQTAWFKVSTMGDLYMQARFKAVGTTTATDGDFAIGFADANTYTSGLPFVVGASSLYTTEAPVEFAGFHYSSIPTSGTLFGASGNPIGIKTEKASTGALAVSSGVVKDSLYHTYGVWIDKAGTARFFIDGVQVGSVASAITTTTGLLPYAVVIGKNSHAHTGTLDYIGAAGGIV